MPGDNARYGGYPVALFCDQDLVSELICAICQEVSRNVLSLQCKGHHIFCRSCLENYFQAGHNTDKCPLCRGAITPFRASVESHLQKIIPLLKIQCPYNVENDENDYLDCNNNNNNNSKNGKNEILKYKCPWQGNLKDANNHLMKSCLLHKIACQACRQLFPRYQTEIHVKKCLPLLYLWKLVIMNQLRNCNFNHFPKELINILLNFIDMVPWYYEFECDCGDRHGSHVAFPCFGQNSDIPETTHYVTFYNSFTRDQLTSRRNINPFATMNVLLAKPSSTDDINPCK